MEICDEFDIPYTESVQELIKQLTELQSEIHPDANPNYDEKDNEKISRIAEAKKYLRELKSS